MSIKPRSHGNKFTRTFRNQMAPYIYSCVRDGYVNNCIPYVDDRKFLAIFLLSMMRSFDIAFSEESEPNFSFKKVGYVPTNR